MANNKQPKLPIHGLTLAREISCRLAENVQELLQSTSTVSHRHRLEAFAAELARLQQALQSAGEVLTDLTDVVVPRYQLTPLSALTSLILEELSPSAAHKGVEFDIVHRHNMPDQVVVDQGRLAELLRSLLTDAIEISAGDTISLTKHLDTIDVQSSNLPAALLEHLKTATHEAALLSLSIKVRLAALPEASGQPDSAYTPSGVPPTLAGCNELCKLLGGTLLVQDLAEAEQLRVVTIPCALPNPGNACKMAQPENSASGHVVQSASAPASAASSHRAARQKPLSILLAEDSEVSRMLLLAQLSQLGYRADAVANGEEVLRALHARSYDVLLLDIRMPVLDGVATTKRIRANKRGHQPYIVAVTGSELPGDKDEFSAAGIDSLLPKPVKLEELAAALTGIFDSKVSAHPAGDPIPGTGADPGTLNQDKIYSQLGAAAGELLKRVIPVFIREMPSRREALSEAFAAGDAEAFARVCHGLKGSSRSVGANRLGDECARLEDLGYSGTLPVKAELEFMMDMVRQTIVALEQELLRLETDSS